MWSFFVRTAKILYTGIEFAAGSAENERLLGILSSEFPSAFERLPFKQEVGIGIKPISRMASQRITRAAIQWALQNNRKKLTLVHKGNIMKYTEGAFLNWGYDVAEQEFVDKCFTQRHFLEVQKASGTAEAQAERARAEQAGMIMLNDVIADVAFEQAILQPQSFDVLVTTNLNGDYLSDAFAALAGGVGISPGANINPELGLGVFEANHGSAEAIAGQDKANPCSLILSGAMLLDFAGWPAAADLVRAGVQRAIADRKVTFDLARLIPDAQVVGTRQFTQQIITLM